MDPLPPTINTNNIGYTIVTILFALSMIAERIANLYKLYWRTMRNKTMDPAAEKLRERKVMWTALVTGWIVAVGSGADLFRLLSTGQLAGSGEKITDFLFKHIKTNNACPFTFIAAMG